MDENEPKKTSNAGKKITKKTKPNKPSNNQPVNKSTPKLTPLPSQPINNLNVKNLHELPDHVISSLLKEVLIKGLQTQESRVRQTQNQLDAMVSTCQEFLKSFIILGYSFDGEPVHPIVHATCQQDADSLGAYLSKFVQFNIVNNNNKNGNSDMFEE